MTDRPKRGGLREPPGGRPSKGNVRMVCYVPPSILEEIDKRRGELTRGEFVTGLVKSFATEKNSKTGPIDSQIDSYGEKQNDAEASF